jgi:hypothetical protein
MAPGTRKDLGYFWISTEWHGHATLIALRWRGWRKSQALGYNADALIVGGPYCPRFGQVTAERGMPAADFTHRVGGVMLAAILLFRTVEGLEAEVLRANPRVLL